MHGTRPFTGKMLIGGKLVESVDGQWLDSINPADETMLGLVTRLRPGGGTAPWDEAAVAALARRVTATVGPALRAAVRSLADAGDAAADLEQLVLWRVLRGLPAARLGSEVASIAGSGSSPAACCLTFGVSRPRSGAVRRSRPGRRAPT